MLFPTNVIYDRIRNLLFFSLCKHFSFVNFVRCLKITRQYNYKWSNHWDHTFFFLFFLYMYMYPLNNTESINLKHSYKSVNLHYLGTVKDCYRMKQRYAYHRLKSSNQGDNLCHVWLQVGSQNKQYHPAWKNKADLKIIILKRPSTRCMLNIYLTTDFGF